MKALTITIGEEVERTTIECHRSKDGGEKMTAKFSFIQLPFKKQVDLVFEQSDNYGGYVAVYKKEFGVGGIEHIASIDR